MTDKDDEVAELRRRLAELERRPTDKPVRATPTAGGGFKGGFFGCLGAIVALIVLVIVLASIGASLGSHTNSTTNASSAAPSTISPKSDTSDAAAIATENWTYDEDEDKLSGKKSRTACSTSINEVQESFPYKSGAVRLCVRRDPRFGLDVFAQLVGTGQVLCTSYSGCTLPVRFDDAPPTKFSGNGASDSSTETVFLKPAAKMIARLKTSKRVVIGLTLYQQGQQSIEWKTAGLKWQ